MIPFSILLGVGCGAMDVDVMTVVDVATAVEVTTLVLKMTLVLTTEFVFSTTEVVWKVVYDVILDDACVGADD